jgi:GNAT superfamily N-acetyltransferase
MPCRRDDGPIRPRSCAHICLSLPACWHHGRVTRSDATTIRVRRPTPDDAARLGAINSASWRHAYADIVPTDFLERYTPDLLARRWQSNLTEPRSGVSYLVAEVGGVLCSYVVIGDYRPQEDAVDDEDTGGWGEIYAIYTHPDQQGRGAGATLHDAALAELGERGCMTAALWVLAANDASRRWYAARGWHPDGATSQWDGAGEPLVEVRLVRDLGP